MNSLGNKEIMAKNIQYYLDKKGIDRNEMCSDLGFKYTTVSNWLQGNKYPRIDKIEMMARYFGINKADLVEEHSISSTPSEPEYTEEEKGIVRGYRKAPDNLKQVVKLTLQPYMVEAAAVASPNNDPNDD